MAERVFKSDEMQVPEELISTLEKVERHEELVVAFDDLEAAAQLPESAVVDVELNLPTGDSLKFMLVSGRPLPCVRTVTIARHGDLESALPIFFRMIADSLARVLGGKLSRAALTGGATRALPWKEARRLTGGAAAAPDFGSRVEELSRKLQEYERFEDYFLFNPDAIVILDLEGQVVDASPNAARLFNVYPEQALGCRIETVLGFAPAGWRRFSESFAQVGDGRRIGPLACELTTREGATLECQVKGAPFYRAGNVAGGVFVFRESDPRYFIEAEQPGRDANPDERSRELAAGPRQASSLGNC